MSKSGTVAFFALPSNLPSGSFDRFLRLGDSLTFQPFDTPQKTMNKIKIFLVAGARPNFMKIAPLFHESKKHDPFICRIVHTGQHYDLNMSDAFFNDLPELVSAKLVAFGMTRRRRSCTDWSGRYSIGGPMRRSSSAWEQEATWLHPGVRVLCSLTISGC